MSDHRLSIGIKNTGLTMIFFGILIAITPSVTTLPATGTSAGGFRSLGFLLLLAGGVLVAGYYFFYKVHSGFRLVTRDGKAIEEGWHLGFFPHSARLIHSTRRNLDVGKAEDLIELETPDNGVLGATVNVSYSPDFDNPASMVNFHDFETVDKSIGGRVRGALASWSMGKPLPGTTKRALAMQKEAETYVRNKLSGISTELTVANVISAHLFQNDFLANDLGIRVHEVNITTWTPIEHGTGKPDWGDGDHIGFDAEAIFKQFHAHADSLSSLRKLKDALIDRYKEEASDINSIYEQVRISMKETRDR